MDDRASRLHLASRMGAIAPFEVMEIQTLARSLEAQGRDVIHLEIGEPDFTTPAPVVEAARRALDAKTMFYTGCRAGTSRCDRSCDAPGPGRSRI